jgi:hypothetical protein
MEMQLDKKKGEQLEISLILQKENNLKSITYE